LQYLCKGCVKEKVTESWQKKKKSLINTAKYKSTMVKFQTTGTLLDKWNETF